MTTNYDISEAKTNSTDELSEIRMKYKTFVDMSLGTKWLAVKGFIGPR